MQTCGRKCCKRLTIGDANALIDLSLYILEKRTMPDPPMWTYESSPCSLYKSVAAALQATQGWQPWYRLSLAHSPLPTLTKAAKPEWLAAWLSLRPGRGLAGPVQELLTLN
eukprot:1144417-Pelagomonas_calceolata.AAC.2